MGRCVIPNGKYYYRRHKYMWGVWKKVVSPNGIELDEFIRDFSTQDAAKAFVYFNNGWSPK